jgi:hypothetical protein
MVLFCVRVLMLALYDAVGGGISFNLCREDEDIHDGERSPSEGAGEYFVVQAGKTSRYVENAI